MDSSEQRVIGSLLLLLGLSLLALGIYTGQLETVLKIVREIFETAIAGGP